VLSSDALRNGLLETLRGAVLRRVQQRRRQAPFCVLATYLHAS
jgi:hypothetical protein